MEITAKKGSNIRQLLEYAAALLERSTPEYPLLSEDLELDLPLMARAVLPCHPHILRCLHQSRLPGGLYGVGGL